jgi:hypothetical protein
MIVSMFTMVLAWMHMLAPGRDVDALAWAVAVNATSETEAAIMTAVAFRESSLRNDVTGDGGHSVCAFQIYDGSKALLQDPIECARVGVRMLRESRRVDPTSPLAFYARGPRYKGEEAKRISRDRMSLAARLMKQR